MEKSLLLAWTSIDFRFLHIFKPSGVTPQKQNTNWFWASTFGFEPLF